MPALNQLYEQFRDRADFYVIYITEAHPTDIWQSESNLRDKVLFASPANEEERTSLAGACVRKLGIKLPALVDEFGNSTEAAYTGWPDRMYLIDGRGKSAPNRWNRAANARVPANTPGA